jgi:ferredoxin
MEKIVINKENCIKCGACMGIAPDNFEVQDDGATVINQTITDDVKNAKDCCPVGAIQIIDDKK